MKKLFLLATAALLVTGVSFAEGGKGKKKKCAKGKSCCSKTTKSCCKDKAKTAKL
ncbi:MAG TPA: hypothetical protein PLC48_01955 [Ferruginibacter sp.]|nr:hypothetical protein [Ferruginibacter sp.]